MAALLSSSCGGGFVTQQDGSNDARPADGAADVGLDGDPLPDDDDVFLPEDDAEAAEDVTEFGEDDAATDAGSDAATVTDAGTITDSGTPPACMPHTYRLLHLQSSQQRTDTEANRNASMNAAFNSGAQTICWTEIENLSDVRHIDAHAGWDTYWPSGRPELVARNAVPIAWRTDTFRLVRGQVWLASEGMAGVSPSRWVARVWLRHIASGKVISRVSHHAVSGVDGAGSPPVDWRRRMHALDIAKFRAVMLLDTVPVIGSGDFNTVRLRSLLGTSFLYDVPASGGSHGSRLIDWIVRRPNSQQRLVGVRFITVGSSDHRGVLATYDYTPPCP